MMDFSGKDYDTIIGELFVRFPSFQKIGAGAYKPGIKNMVEFDALLGHPHRRYPTVHVAGTNGKGSVCSMIASVCAAAGLRTGLYTSPHIEDFRERMRIVEGSAVRYIGRGDVLRFLQRWRGEMDRLDLSFFEITTAMAFSWFATQKVDVAVIETGLGGRLDSTNIITPVLSVVTNIGMDHCDMLGSTLAQIAGEKAGIFKRGIPAVVGESHPETDPVFRAKAAEVNSGVADGDDEGSPFDDEEDDPFNFLDLNDERMKDAADFLGLGRKSKKDPGRFLIFADRVEPELWWRKDEILRYMDLQGSYQQKNLRTALVAVDMLSGRLGSSGQRLGEASAGRKSQRGSGGMPTMDDYRDFLRKDKISRSVLSGIQENVIVEGIEHTAARTEFHGRWERLGSSPTVIADIGHNSHGLRYNFAQLEQMMRSGRFSSLQIIYGTMADKDVDEIMKLFPRGARCHFVTASNRRAMSAQEIMDHYLAAGHDPDLADCTDLREAIVLATSDPAALVYIGGSAYLVSEAVPLLTLGV